LSNDLFIEKVFEEVKTLLCTKAHLYGKLIVHDDWVYAQ